MDIKYIKRKNILHFTTSLYAIKMEKLEKRGNKWENNNKQPTSSEQKVIKPL